MIIAFEKNLIIGLYHNDPTSYFILTFPKTSMFREYYWSIPTSKITINYSAEEANYIKGFNNDKCWIEVGDDTRFKVYRFNSISNKTDRNTINDVIEVTAEEMLESLKPKYPYGEHFLTGDD